MSLIAWYILKSAHTPYKPYIFWKSNSFCTFWYHICHDWHLLGLFVWVWNPVSFSNWKFHIPLAEAMEYTSWTLLNQYLLKFNLFSWKVLIKIKKEKWKFWPGHHLLQLFLYLGLFPGVINGWQPVCMWSYLVEISLFDPTKYTFSERSWHNLEAKNKNSHTNYKFYPLESNYG